MRLSRQVVVLLCLFIVGTGGVQAGGYYWDKAHRFEMWMPGGWHRIDKPPAGYALPDKTDRYGFRAGWLRNTGRGRAVVIVMVLPVLGSQGREPVYKVRKAIEQYLLSDKRAQELKSREQPIDIENGIVVEAKGSGDGISLGEGKAKRMVAAWVIVPLAGKTWNLVVAGESAEYPKLWKEAQGILADIRWGITQSNVENAPIEMKSSPGSYFYNGGQPPAAPLSGPAGPPAAQKTDRPIPVQASGAAAVRSAGPPRNIAPVPARLEAKNASAEPGISSGAASPSRQPSKAVQPDPNWSKFVRKLMDEGIWPRLVEESHRRSVDPADFTVEIIRDYLDRMLVPAE